MIKDLYRYILLLSLLLPLALTNQLRAQEFRVTSALEQDTILLGDQIKMTIVAEYPIGSAVSLPLLTDSVAPGVEIIKLISRDSSTVANNRIQLTQSYLITAFDSGPHPIPPVRAILRQSLSTDTLRSNSLQLFVHVPAVDLQKGIADIKKPFEAPLTLKEVAPWILGIILIGSILFLIIYAIIRRKKNIPFFAIPPKPATPPYIVALTELEKLKEEQLWQHDKIKEYYTRLTDIIRVYLEESFGVRAMELTTQEIIEILRAVQTPVKGDLIDGLGKTLNTADLVKFAKYVPYIDEHHSTLNFAFKLVEETKPADETMIAPDQKKTTVAETTHKNVDQEKNVTHE